MSLEQRSLFPPEQVIQDSSIEAAVSLMTELQKSQSIISIIPYNSHSATDQMFVSQQNLYSEILIFR